MVWRRWGSLAKIARACAETACLPSEKESGPELHGLLTPAETACQATLRMQRSCDAIGLVTNFLDNW
jgi:hypothetical protein